MPTPNEIIAEIRAVQDELCALGMKREYIKFYKLSVEQLEEIRQSIGEQLDRRRKFLEANK